SRGGEAGAPQEGARRGRPARLSARGLGAPRLRGRRVLPGLVALGAGRRARGQPRGSRDGNPLASARARDRAPGDRARTARRPAARGVDLRSEAGRFADPRGKFLRRGGGPARGARCRRPERRRSRPAALGAGPRRVRAPPGRRSSGVHRASHRGRAPLRGARFALDFERYSAHLGIVNEANEREQAPRSGPLSAVPIHEIVTRWDLDKTYLRSRFDTLRELVAAALEPPERKRSVPGASAVLRELSTRGAWVHILSGSPRQMRRKLIAKLALDGVRWNELTLKPNLSNLLFLRFQALRDQLGYKLPELLKARARDERRLDSGPTPREVLVGDDSESDAFVYSLYADLCAGVVTSRELERVLRAGRAYEATVVACRQALAQVPRVPVVD